MGLAWLSQPTTQALGQRKSQRQSHRAMPRPLLGAENALNNPIQTSCITQMIVSDYTDLTAAYAIGGRIPLAWSYWTPNLRNSRDVRARQARWRFPYAMQKRLSKVQRKNMTPVEFSQRLPLNSSRARRYVNIPGHNKDSFLKIFAPLPRSLLCIFLFIFFSCP